MKQSLLFLLLTACFSLVHGTPPITTNKNSITLQPPYRGRCGVLKLDIKENLPYLASQIEVIGFKYNPSATIKLQQMGSCLLSEFPKTGIKFDRPSWRSTIYYQVRFAIKTDQKYQFLPVSDIINRAYITQQTWCPRVRVPYAPLELHTRLTTGEKIALGSAAVALVTGGLLYKYHQKNIDQEIKKKQLIPLDANKTMDTKKNFHDQLTSIKNDSIAYQTVGLLTLEEHNSIEPLWEKIYYMPTYTEQEVEKKQDATNKLREKIEQMAQPRRPDLARRRQKEKEEEAEEKAKKITATAQLLKKAVPTISNVTDYMEKNPVTTTTVGLLLTAFPEMSEKNKINYVRRRIESNDRHYVDKINLLYFYINRAENRYNIKDPENAHEAGIKLQEIDNQKNTLDTKEKQIKEMVEGYSGTYIR